MRLEGKAAIVTGAAGRIGRAIASRFAREGASVVVSDVNEEKAAQVADEIKASGAAATAIAADVSKSQEVNRMVETALEQFGVIDILVNNAGGSAGLLKRLSLFHNIDRGRSLGPKAAV